MNKYSDGLQHFHFLIIFILKISSFWSSSLGFQSLCLSLRSKHHCSSLVSISVLCGLRPFGPWTLSALSALCLIIHCCAVALSSQPWLLCSLGQTDHEGSGWPAQSCLEHWQQLSHPIPSACYFQHVCLEIKGFFSQYLDSGGLMAVFEYVNVPTEEI